MCTVIHHIECITALTHTHLLSGMLLVNVRLLPQGNAQLRIKKNQLFNYYLLLLPQQSSGSVSVTYYASFQTGSDTCFKDSVYMYIQSSLPVPSCGNDVCRLVQR